MQFLHPRRPLLFSGVFCVVNLFFWHFDQILYPFEPTITSVNRSKQSRLLLRLPLSPHLVRNFLLLLLLSNSLVLFEGLLFHPFSHALHEDIGVFGILACSLKGAPLFIDLILLQLPQLAPRPVDLVFEEAAQLGSIDAEAELRKAAEHASDAHVVVERSQQGLVKSLLKVRVPRPAQLPRDLALHANPVEPEHHRVRCDISLKHALVSLENGGLLERERPCVCVEARLKRVGKQPLDEGVISLETLVIVSPMGVHLGDELAVGPRRHLIHVELHVHMHLLFRLLLKGRFRLNDGRAGEGGKRRMETLGMRRRMLLIGGLRCLLFSLLLRRVNCGIIVLRARSGLWVWLADASAVEEACQFRLIALLE